MATATMHDMHSVFDAQIGNDAPTFAGTISDKSLNNLMSLPVSPEIIFHQVQASVSQLCGPLPFQLAT